MANKLAAAVVGIPIVLLMIGIIREMWGGGKK